MAARRVGEAAEKTTIPAFAAVKLGGWAASPSLAVTVHDREGARGGTTIIDSDRVRIGAHESNDVVVRDELVSRFHCQLAHVPADDRWRLCDSGSLNGTRIGSLRVRDVDVPPSGIEIEIGATVLSIRPHTSRTRSQLPRVTSCGSLQGQSEAMRKMFALIERVAPTDATVLIEGESGTGKEFVATELARRSARADGPFVIVDCGAISPQLVESTLFGHARGAFTGAERDREGAFEAAHGGTIFLDEIGELPLEMQPRLLRALESRTVCRLGESRRRPVDVRILAATNRELAREMNHGRFREDLYFRLSVVTIRVPPLRERLEDLRLLVHALVEALGRDAKRDEIFDDALLARMAEYDWPGNVRELRNFVERSVIMRCADHLGHSAAAASTSPRSARGRASSSEADPSKVSATVDVAVPFRRAKEELVAAFERSYIAALLRSTNGNVTRAARQAGMDRINLHRLIQRHGLAAGRSIND